MAIVGSSLFQSSNPVQYGAPLPYGTQPSQSYSLPSTMYVPPTPTYTPTAQMPNIQLPSGPTLYGAGTGARQVFSGYAPGTMTPTFATVPDYTPTASQTILDTSNGKNLHALPISQGGFLPDPWYVDTPANRIQSNAMRSLIGQNGGVQSAQKNPAQASRIGQSYQDYDTLRGQQQQSLTDFARSYLSTDPTAKGYTDQESSSLGGIYNGTELSGLNAATDATARARAAATDRGLGAAKRTSALFRLNNGGNSSYADAQLADQAAGIATQGALADSTQRRENLMYNQGRQSANIGRRGQLLTDYLGRQLQPVQARSQLFSNELTDLGGMGNLDAANTFYQTPFTGASTSPFAREYGLNQRYGGQPNPRSFFAKTGY